MDASKDPVEKRNLREAACERGIENAEGTFAEFATRRIEAQAVEKSAETAAGVLLELSGKHGATHAGELKQVFQADLFSEMRAQMPNRIGDGPAVSAPVFQGERAGRQWLYFTRGGLRNPIEHP